MLYKGWIKSTDNTADDDSEFESCQLCGHEQGLLDALVQPAATVCTLSIYCSVQNVDFYRDSASTLIPGLRNYRNVPGSKLKWHLVVVHKNVSKDCVKSVAIQCCHIAH